MPTEMERDLDAQLAMTHERFVTAMTARLPSMSFEQKERYFAVLSALVTRLESPEKGLRTVLQELVTEVGPYVFQELGRRD